MLDTYLILKLVIGEVFDSLRIILTEKLTFKCCTLSGWQRRFRSCFVKTDKIPRGQSIVLFPYNI